MVVTAGTSAAVEAACMGIPVIVVGRPAGLDMNPLGAVDERLWHLVYDGEELSAAVGRWTPAHPLLLAERIKLGGAIRDATFEPVTDEGMRAFLPTSEEVVGLGSDAGRR